MNFADIWVASSQHVAIKYMLVRPPQLFWSGGYKALKMVQIRSPIPIVDYQLSSYCIQIGSWFELKNLYIQIMFKF